MGLRFDFTRLLKKYSVACQLIRETGGGKYEGGNWVPDPSGEPETIQGALIPITDRKIYQSGGTYTAQDRELITQTGIPWNRRHTSCTRGPDIMWNRRMITASTQDSTTTT